MDECNKYDTYIEKRFFEKLYFINDKNLRKRVELAWLSDKEYYTGLTKTIVYEFMNYSLHDESHSASILQNIYSLLGKEKIDLLSIGDLWLLLEAAYSHDIGMSTDYQDLRDLWIDENSIDELVNDIINTDDKDIIGTYKQIEEWLDKNEKNLNKANFEEKNRSWPLEIRKGITYINTVYIRKNHAKRSKEKILQMISGKDDLTIEDRLYKIVADIDYLHNANFDEIFGCFESVETGFETDNIHPRLIAQLLRVGDVLDIRNNRFEYRNIVYNGGLPDISQTQYDKHKAVTRFYIDTKEILVHIESKNVITCQSARQWLDWIQFELDHLIQSWNLFTEGFIGNLELTKIELIVKNGIYDYSDEDYNTFLKADSNRMLDLLMGSNFYDSSFVLFREYVQNAIDATKVKLALNLLQDEKYIKDIKPVKFVDILPNKILSKEDDLFNDHSNIFEKNRIEIEISMDEDISQIKNKNMFVVKIKDYGIGMDEVGLGTLFSIGKSWNGRKKIKNEFSKIPVWLTPTGGFGIGFLSGFLLSNKIKIQTNSKEGYRYYLTIHSPQNGAKIEKRVDKIKYADSGTEFILEIDFFEYYRQLVNYLNQNDISIIFKNTNMAEIFEYNIFNRQDQLRIISISLKNILQRYILNTVIPIKITTPQLPMYSKLEENSIYNMGDYTYELNKIKSILECNSYWSYSINGIVRFNLKSNNSLTKVGYKGILVNEIYKDDDNSILLNLCADCIASIDLFENNVKDILNINRSSLKNDYQLESIINSIFLEYLKNFISGLEKFDINDKMNIFTHYKIVKLLIHYQEFVRDEVGIELLTDSFDDLYYYDNFNQLINLELFDEINQLLSETNVFKDILQYDSMTSFSENEVAIVYSGVNKFLQEYKKLQSVLNNKAIGKKYVNYINNMKEIFEEYISKISYVDDKESINNNIECLVRLKEKYQEIENDELLKGIKVRRESFINHLFEDRNFYCLVKENPYYLSSEKYGYLESCKKDDLEVKNLFYFDFNNLKDDERNFNTFNNYLRELLRSNSNIDFSMSKIDNLKSYVLYKITNKKHVLKMSEKENEKDIVELIYRVSENYDNEKDDDILYFIPIDNRSVGKYEALLLYSDDHLINDDFYYSRYCIVNPFEKYVEGGMNVLALNNILNCNDSDDKIRNTIVNCENYKMKVEYIYLSKLKELGQKNVNKADIEKAYIELIMDVINFARKKQSMILI